MVAIYDPNKTRGVIDDHAPANNAGIPAINFIDINYVENASMFGGHWVLPSTMILQTKSVLNPWLHWKYIELGLITSAWTLLPTNSEGEF